MPLRVAFDLDGTLADFASAYKEIEVRLFGPGEMSARVLELANASKDDDQVADEGVVADGQPSKTLADARKLRRKHDVVWQTIQSTPDFWRTLPPTDPDAVRRIHAAAIEHKWEVVFLTQRPKTAGETVQRQTQRWLVEQGFDLPSVFVVTESRGAAARALGIDYLVDDSPKNCIDAIADVRAKPILILRNPDPVGDASARKLGIVVAWSISECLDILEQASIAQAQPSLLSRIASIVGWK